MRPIAFVFIAFFASNALYAQLGLPTTAGAQGAAMGGVGINFRDIHGAFADQAGLAWVEKTSFMLLSEARFAGVQLNAAGAAVAVPVGGGTVGLCAQYLGTDGYTEQKIGLAYARKVGNRFSFGAQFDYLGIRIPQYGAANLVTFELGLQTEIFKGFWIAAHAYSPIPIKFADTERLPSVVRIGVSYQPSEQILLATEVGKDLDYPDFSWRAGLSYRIVPNIWIRAGVGTAPTKTSLGLGFALAKSWRIDVAAAYQDRIGFSPVVGLIYQPK